MTYRDSPNWPDRQKWDEVRAIGLKAMQVAAPLKDGTPDEWAQNFVGAMLFKQTIRDAQWPFSEVMRGCIAKQAARFVESELQRLRRRRKIVSTFTEMQGDEEGAMPFEPADTRPLPEDTAILADIVYMALLRVDTEKRIAQYTFWHHVADERLFTELARETGQPADNLRHLCARVIKRLNDHASGRGLTEEEIRDYLNTIDRHRHGIF